jgi:hypothetical protein
MADTLVAQRHRERGEGRIGTLIGLLMLGAFGYAVFHVGPVFVADYGFKDKMNELARVNRGTWPDEKIVDLLMKETRDRGLDDVIQRTDIKIHTVESSRRIYCEYDRTVKVLPGWEKTFHFVDDVEQPLIF